MDDEINLPPKYRELFKGWRREVAGGEMKPPPITTINGIRARLEAAAVRKKYPLLFEEWREDLATGRVLGPPSPFASRPYKDGPLPPVRSPGRKNAKSDTVD